MKTLLFDIETSPSLGFVWSKWQTDVIAFEQEWYMLSFAWKWLGEQKTHVLALPDFPLYKEDPENDSALVTALHKLFDEADVIIAHNCDRFDRPKSNARFLVQGLDPPAPYKTIDTLKVARRYFGFTSNKLDDLCQMLGIGSKLPHNGFHTWRGCMTGDEKSWKTMRRYNKHDVILLEELYLKFRPWIENHPPANVIDGEPEGCPKCGHKGNQRRGIRHCSSYSYVQFQCLGCGGYYRARVAEKQTRPLYVN